MGKEPEPDKKRRVWRRVARVVVVAVLEAAETRVLVVLLRYLLRRA